MLDYSYKDYLQAPLQPLMNNLESLSYETFENDAAKYVQYQAALTQALKDYKQFGYFRNQIPPRNEENKLAIPSIGVKNHETPVDVEMKEEQKSIDKSKANAGVVKILLVGAGRGPLIRCAFRSSAETGVNIKIVAIEKNPNAVVTLRNLMHTEPWGNNLTVISTDIRDWNTADVFDIIVSELLGSFGDNELSPECLSAAQKFLRRSTGIFIPYQYTSFLHPVNSTKLWIEARNLPGPFPYEIPYVVKIYSGTFIGSPQPVFEFEHPTDHHQEGAMYSHLEFHATENTSYIHGFAGYFDSALYDKVHNSIVPESHTVDLHSWFPIFFPIREALLVEPKDVVHVYLWRCKSETKVWYEWSIGVQSSATGAMRITGIHNPKGRAYSIGLY